MWRRSDPVPRQEMDMARAAAVKTETQVLEGAAVDKLTAELRRRGLVVCVFQPEDVANRRRTKGWSDGQCAAWLEANSRFLVDILSERGSDAIDDLLMVT
jgi:hypothetical protein